MTITNKQLHKRLISSVLLGLFAVLGSACSGDGKPAGAAQGAAAAAVPVNVQEAKPQAVPITVEAVGQTEGAREVEVRARVGGILVKRVYEEGAVVRAGQTLFQIDRVPLEIAAAQAKAKLAETQVLVEQTARESARMKGLLDQKAVSQKEFDDAVSAEALARATLLGAKASLRQAELDLSYSSVTAPVSGISGRAAVSEGTLVNTSTGSLLTTIVQSDPIWARFSVADADAAVLRLNSGPRSSIRKIELVLPDGSVYPLPGKLNFEARQIDPTRATVELRAEFPNREGRLLPGQFVRVRLTSGNREGAYLVSQKSVLQADQGRFVYVVGADNKVQIRPIKTAGSQGTDWVVVEGIAEGDRIVLDNLLKLRPGSLVKAEQAGNAPAGADPKPAGSPPASGKS